MRTSALRAALAAIPFLVACGGSSAESAPPKAASDAPREEASTPVDETTPSGSEPEGDAKPEADVKPGDEAEKPLGEGDSRNNDNIAAVVKEHRKEARACYEAGQKQVAGLKGDLVVNFTLKPSGEVKHAELNKERSTLTEASVVKCVIGVITALKFPKSSKGLESTVNYPFNFTP